MQMETVTARSWARGRHLITSGAAVLSHRFIGQRTCARVCVCACMAPCQSTISAAAASTGANSRFLVTHTFHTVTPVKTAPHSVLNSSVPQMLRKPPLPPVCSDGVNNMSKANSCLSLTSCLCFTHFNVYYIIFVGGFTAQYYILCSLIIIQFLKDHFKTKRGLLQPLVRWSVLSHAYSRHGNHSPRHIQVTVSSRCAGSVSEMRFRRFNKACLLYTSRCV